MISPKERPIIFTGQSPALIRNDVKTMTRRVVNLDRLRVTLRRTVHSDIPGDGIRALGAKTYPAQMNRNGAVSASIDGRLLGLKPGEFDFICPYADGETWLVDHGDRKRWTIPPHDSKLWVKEPWAAMDIFTGGVELDTPRCIGYRADQTALSFRDDLTSFVPDQYNWNWDSEEIRWRSPLYLYKWAACTWLRVTEVRVERVQDISVEDIVAEGVRVELNEGSDINNVKQPDDFERRTEAQKESWYENMARAVYIAKCDNTDRLAVKFADLWDSINTKRGYGWDVNPWVWAITFERTEAP